MPKTIQIVVNKSKGTVRSIYTDEMQNFYGQLGPISVARATDVEPYSTEDGGIVWGATLRDTGGHVIATEKTRQAAIEKEIAYLNEHILPHSEKFEEILPDAAN